MGEGYDMSIIRKVRKRREREGNRGWCLLFLTKKILFLFFIFFYYFLNFLIFF